MHEILGAFQADACETINKKDTSNTIIAYTPVLANFCRIMPLRKSEVNHTQFKEQQKFMADTGVINDV